MSASTKTVKKSTKLVVAPTNNSGIECPKCTHHSSKRTFHNSCPRTKELLFLGGDKSATQIIEDVRVNGCGDFNLKGDAVKEISTQTGPQPPFPREGLCGECSIEWYVQSDGRVTCYAIMDSGGGYLKKCPFRSCRLMHRIEPGRKMGAIIPSGGSS